MSIDGIGFGFLRSGRAREVKDSERPGGSDPSGASPTPAARGDSVEISAQARDLAATGSDEQRLDEIRSRVEDGVYDRPSVAEEVARRILASGDVI